MCQCMDGNEQIGGFGSGKGREAAPGGSRCWRRTSANNRWQQRRLRRLAAGKRMGVTSASGPADMSRLVRRLAPAARRPRRPTRTLAHIRRNRHRAGKHGYPQSNRLLTRENRVVV